MLRASSFTVGRSKASDGGLTEIERRSADEKVQMKVDGRTVVQMGGQEHKNQNKYSIYQFLQSLLSNNLITCSEFCCLIKICC